MSLPSPEPLPSSARSYAPPLAPGAHVGRFTIVRWLASGSASDVYEVEHDLLGRRLALKVVRAAEDDSFGSTLARFRREVAVGGALAHPHVADVYDGGVVELGAPYLVMELLDGESLADRLARGPLDVDTCVAIATQLLEALVHVHGRGLAHGDVEPSNVFLHRAGDATVAKLIDFGLAAPSGARNGEIGPLVGTPAYMAPELLLGAARTSAHDVYAVGVLLYACLTGRVPHEGSTSASVLADMASGAVIPIRACRPECPDALARTVMRAIDRHPHERFASAAALATALARTRTRTQSERGTRDKTRATSPTSSGVRIRSAVATPRARWSATAAWIALSMASAALIGAAHALAEVVP